MKIGIDAQTTIGEKTGLGFYVENLLNQLKKIDRHNQYIPLAPSNKSDLSAPKRFAWDQFGVLNLAKKNKVDIFHQPCFSVPVLKGKIKTVVTIHDLIATKYGKDLPFFARTYFGKWMTYTYKYANKIICDSQNTKKDVMDMLNIPEKKISVIHLAANELYSKSADKNKILGIKNKYKTGEKYLLHVGTLNPRKNIQFIINIFQKITGDLPGYKLVITGKKSWYYQTLVAEAKRLNIMDKVIFTGYVPDEDTPYLINGAEIFLFPSLYEGFGLPPLEAMTAGIPVISSNSSSLPEVVGEGGILLSPTDELGWIRNIKAIINNPNLKRSLIAKGLKQAKKFSWQKCALETLEVYEELLREK